MSLRTTNATYYDPGPQPAPERLEARNALQAPVTIASSLGLDPNMPHRPYVRFQPQYKTPEPVGNVVDDMFDGYDADPVPLGAMFGKKKGGEKKKGGGLMGGLKAAKDKADAAVRKAASGVKAGIKGATDLASGLARFDYKLYTEPISALLATAKKANGTTLSDKNNYKAFEGDAAYKGLVKVAQAQEAKMTRTESMTKNIKGKESKTISKQIKGRNAACLGFAHVNASQESDDMFSNMIYPPAQAAGIPTLVTLNSEFDTNGKDTGMLPITGLVVKAVDADDVEVVGDDGVTISMGAVPAIKIGASEETITRDEFDFKYSLCVHGIFVDGDKHLHTGPQILVPAGKAGDVSAYGIVTDTGIERALSHAIEGTKIDLLLLWTSFKLVHGAKGLSNMALDPAQKKAAKELFGSLDDMQTQNSFSEMFEDEAYGELNVVPM
jgi:hypothetical protein